MSLGQQLFAVGPGDVALTSDDWYTPRWLFDAAGLVFGMDVCAPVAPEMRTCPALEYLTIIEDGLTAAWSGVVWMNPPYSNPGPWIDRWSRHPDGLALLAATRSKSTQVLLNSAEGVTFFTGQFHRPNGDVDHNPWLLMVAARGDTAFSALHRIAQAKQTPVWARADPSQ